jgi:hypothetical protein
MEKFEKLNSGTKIITIWGPLPNCLPEKVNFPYIINTIPLKKANSLQEQLLAVFGVKCVDFVTAWEFAERYTKAIGNPKVKNDRFLGNRKSKSEKRQISYNNSNPSNLD